MTINSLEPRTVPVTQRLGQWSQQALQLMMRRPLECIAITSGLVVVTLFLCNHTIGIVVDVILAFVVQIAISMTTVIAMDADGRKTALSIREIVPVMIATAMTQLFVAIIVTMIYVGIEFILFGSSYGHMFSLTSLEDMPIWYKLSELSFIWHLWWLIGMVFFWAIILDSGVSVPAALVANQRGKDMNSSLQMIIFFFIMIVNVFPVIAVFVLVFLVFFSYVAYRDIYLGIEQNAKVREKVTVNKDDFRPA